MPITAVYAVFLAVMFLVLSVRTISVRRLNKIEIGDGGNQELLRRVRVHANFAEYVPLALILMALAESMKLRPLWLNAIGIILVYGRISHAYGLSQTPHNLRLRVIGMMATFAAIAAAAVACAVLSFQTLM
jgi:uncharacterized membrane protein YecN with MAPEG domain